MQKMETDIIGNAEAVEALRRVAKSSSLGHAYLLVGPEGVGKRLAGLAFARAINCRCADGSETCDSCRLMDAMSHPELLMLEDASKPKWLRRSRVAQVLGGNADDWRDRYAEVLADLCEKSYIRDPLPRTDTNVALDGFNLSTDEFFGKGSVPSRECYTPGPVSEKIRKQYDRGDLSEPEYGLLRLLYEYPLSVMPYRGAIPIAYVTARQGWKYVRPIQTFLSMRTMLDGKKIVIVDDAHRMTPEAQNCLLKTLEEPPADSVLILVTSDKAALFETIVSRCQVVNFGRLNRSEVAAAVEDLLGGEGEDTRLAALLSENCPGRMLELSMANLTDVLDRVRDLFADIERGRPEAAFGFSRSVIVEAGTHRRKQREMIGQALELIVFWIAQVLRVKQGQTPRDELARYATDLTAHAGAFGQASLLDGTTQIEKAFDLLRWNIDMTLLLDTTLLHLGSHLGSELENCTR
jgi:DNA polymerase-3 subunit delta'